MKPIDILINQLNCSYDLDREIEKPYLVIKNLGIEELEKIKQYLKLKLDFDPVSIHYWEALVVICDQELAEARKEMLFVELY